MESQVRRGARVHLKNDRHFSVSPFPPPCHGTCRLLFQSLGFFCMGCSLFNVWIYPSRLRSFTWFHYPRVWGCLRGNVCWCNTFNGSFHLPRPSASPVSYT